MQKIKTIIIDDEPLACQELAFLMKNFEDFEVIGSYQSYEEALEQIQLARPDLLLLDIELGQKTGFDLLEALESSPEVVFVTAYNQYALEAFAVNALDYLLKPIDPERLARALQKVQQTLQAKPHTATEHLLQKESKVFIREGDDCFFVKIADIFLIESIGNYCKIFFEDKSPFLKKSLIQLEGRLPERLFFRANRHQLINLEYVQHIDLNFKNRLLVYLGETNTAVEISTRQSLRFKELMSL
ncbi:MAG: response regulator transcription factor [Bernardetiaceae bacterium]|nr:response regulator transcription factor [Bernardetiaceae bacterium]